MKRLYLLLFLFAVGEARRVVKTGNFGFLTSTGYPQPYGNNLNDTWTITVNRGYRVVLYFTAFDLEDSFANGEVCGLDYLQIIDGPLSSNQTQGKYCGNPIMFWEDAPALVSQKFRSSAQVLSLRMVSDFSNDLPMTSPPVGFKAHYYAEDRNECTELREAYDKSDEPESVGKCDHYCNNYPGGFYCSCKAGYRLHENGYTCTGLCQDVTILQHEGIITSPGYPSNYPRLTDCNWHIETDAGKTIHFQFNRNFHVEAHDTGACAYDWLKIRDNSGETGPFCGDQAPSNGAEIITTTNWFEIQFHSDAEVEQPGFSLSYRTHDIRCLVPPPPMHGYILSPSLADPMGENYVSFGGLIRYDCNMGFRVIGSAKLLCLKDGSMSDDAPVCEVF
uniref:mannan-binding lectin serine protease 1-like n=1 Tax=Ciona intestinalis TaxID=7719 RepID=UPI000180BCE7|nr:mannan-binding lectin serine protease 1-like [Ciona intestinalis]|eukprot:XP_002129497.1 mannan-binding lectin serine protease 1-like [Ciona intestinalis]